MATSRAIAAVSQGIVANLQWFANASRDFGGLPVALVDDGELAQARPTGLSVFLRGVTLSTTHRNLPTPADRALPPVAIELHYLVTAWGPSAVEQQRLLGWTLRTLHDSPILSADLLNQADSSSAAFGPDEQVELVWEPNPPALSQAAGTLPPSLSYVARTVLLDSEVLGGGPD